MCSEPGRSAEAGFGGTRMTTSLRLGFDPEFAPLTCVETGRPAGSAVEIVRAACMRAGIALELVSAGLGARGDVAGLQLDGFVCMAVTRGRTGFTFSAPYMTTAAALFFGRRTVAQGKEQVTGGIVAATPRAGPLLDLLSERVGAGRPAYDRERVAIARVVPGTDYVDCLERVLRGEVDAAALNADVGRAMAARLFPGAFFEVRAPLPELSLAVALTGEPADAELVLTRLDPAFETSISETSRPGGAPQGRR